VKKELKADQTVANDLTVISAHR